MSQSMKQYSQQGQKGLWYKNKTLSNVMAAGTIDTDSVGWAQSDLHF